MSSSGGKCLLTWRGVEYIVLHNTSKSEVEPTPLAYAKMRLDAEPDAKKNQYAPPQE